MSSFEKFKSLHSGTELFLLPNAWDARSAMAFEQNGFSAVGTSSAAVANSLGYEDGENMSFDDYLFVVRRILSSVKIPVSVDIETGYADTADEIAANVVKLAKLGVAGINIEDSVIEKGNRSLRNAEQFANVVSIIKQKLHSHGVDLFVNIRCDTFILNVNNKLTETANRLAIYNNTGADGIFLPCISNEADISDAVKQTNLPLNVMAIGGLPDFATLNRLGVRRVSMGPFLFHKVYARIAELTEKIKAQKSISSITN